MPSVEIQPVTPKPWADLERLSGERGAYAGCWCMWWRVSRSEFQANANAGNKQALKAIVDGRGVPGLIAYVDGEPAGWVSVDRRERFASLERSRTLARVDDKPVWSIVCFFVGKAHRRRGLMPKLIDAAVAYARDHGARIVEAYPDDHRTGEWTLFMGTRDAFLKAGFREVRSEPRPLLRRAVRPR